MCVCVCVCVRAPSLASLLLPALWSLGKRRVVVVVVVGGGFVALGCPFIYSSTQHQPLPVLQHWNLPVAMGLVGHTSTHTHTRALTHTRTNKHKTTSPPAACDHSYSPGGSAVRGFQSIITRVISRLPVCLCAEGGVPSEPQHHCSCDRPAESCDLGCRAKRGDFISGKGTAMRWEAWVIKPQWFPERSCWLYAEILMCLFHRCKHSCDELWAIFFQAEKSKLWWFQVCKSEELLLFSVLRYSTLNIFGVLSYLRMSACHYDHQHSHVL